MGGDRIRDREQTLPEAMRVAIPELCVACILVIYCGPMTFARRRVLTDYYL